MKTSRALNVALAAMLSAFSIIIVATPMVHATVCGGTISPPSLTNNVAAGSSTSQTWLFTYVGVTPSSTISFNAQSSNGDWTVSVTPSITDGGSGSGTNVPITVTVDAPLGPPSSTQITITASNGACGISAFASGSEIFQTAPEFGLPAMAVASVAFLGLVLMRKRTVSLRN